MIEFRTLTPEDAAELSTMAARSFAATFAGKVEAAELDVYLETAYGPDGAMRRDLADPSIDWRAAFVGDAPVGYIKVSAMSLPFAAPPGAMEVRQLYLAEIAKGTGVADALMHWAIDLSRVRDAGELYLAVFDDNARAVRFYTRHGFVKVGSFTFYTGAQAHEDGIRRLVL